MGDDVHPDPELGQVLARRSYFFTLNERLAGVASIFRAESIARTAKVWLPSFSAGGVWLFPGPEQDAKAAVSIRHSKVEPGSLEENVKVGVLSAVGPVGPESIVVWGAMSRSKTETASEV